MGRRASREIAMKLLYQMDIRKGDNEEQQLEQAFEENHAVEKDRQYITDVITGVHKHKGVIDVLIEKHSKGWKINRISKVDLSILRLCIYEIGFREDIPFNVSVNEAVELAKKYSSDDASSFVNGILSKITAQEILQTENTVDGGHLTVES